MYLQYAISSHICQLIHEHKIHVFLSSCFCICCYLYPLPLSLRKKKEINFNLFVLYSTYKSRGQKKKTKYFPLQSDSLMSLNSPLITAVPLKSGAGLETEDIKQAKLFTSLIKSYGSSSKLCKRGILQTNKVLVEENGKTSLVLSVANTFKRRKKIKKEMKQKEMCFLIKFLRKV